MNSAAKQIEQYPPPPPTECRYCGGPVERLTQREFYGQDYSGRDLFVCQKCGARVGTHKSGKPLGILANGSLRELRGLIHEEFDPLWQESARSRQETYDLLFGSHFGYPPAKRHIAMLTESEAKSVLGYLRMNGHRLRNEGF